MARKTNVILLLAESLLGTTIVMGAVSVLISSWLQLLFLTSWWSRWTELLMGSRLHRASWDTSVFMLACEQSVFLHAFHSFCYCFLLISIICLYYDLYLYYELYLTYVFYCILLNYTISFYFNILIIIIISVKYIIELNTYWLLN